MADELSDFQWIVAENGYRWMETRTAFPPVESGVFLTEANPIGIARPVTRYTPLRLYPGLFKTFAQLKPDQKSIVDFANKYGMLGGEANVEIVLPHPNPGKPGDGLLGHGEQLAVWASEITDMHQMVKIWELVCESNLEELGRFIQWSGETGVRYEIQYEGGGGSFGWIANEHVHPELISRFRHPLIDPALYWLQRFLNDKLAEHGVFARLLWSQKQTLGLHIVPSSLIGCLWLQFANAVAGEKQLRQCPECQTWFDISPHEGRRDKKFCNPSCKAAAHRKSRK